MASYHACKTPQRHYGLSAMPSVLFVAAPTTRVALLAGIASVISVTFCFLSIVHPLRPVESSLLALRSRELCCVFQKALPVFLGKCSEKTLEILVIPGRLVKKARRGFQ